MSASHLQDRHLLSAASRIVARSERQTDIAVLEQTFVDLGVLVQLDNSNSQVLYGRRGTGKSHAFRVLGSMFESRDDYSHIYIDLRAIGSAHSVADTSKPRSLRAVTAFRDICAEIQNRLLEIATDPYKDVNEAAFPAISALGDAITRMNIEVNERTISITEGGSSESESSGGLTASVNTLAAEVRSGSSRTASREATEEFHEALQETLVFSELRDALDKSIAALSLTGLVVLVDEWASVPQDVQPLLAEFMRRTLLPSGRVILKIASLEYRSRFSEAGPAGLVGFELGGDIAANIDLDDYYVHARAPERVSTAFADILLRHLQAELPEDYLKDAYSVSNSDDLVTLLFTESDTFVELVRAGEGVVRDFLGIFNQALFRASRDGSNRITLRAVEDAARDWFETDKATNLTPEQKSVLRSIIDTVIGQRQARCFMLEREKADHPMVQSLFDMRVLHLMRRGYSDKENPGVRYNIYGLDYGTYVDLKRTASQPELDFVDLEEPTPERVVPFDDNRSIRRIVLDPAMLGDVRS